MDNRHPSEDKPWLFKPGQSGNLAGCKPVPADIKLLQREKSHEYKRKFMYWCDVPVAQVRDCTGSPWDITAMDRMICSAIVQGMNGNYKAFNAILDRIIGKPVHHVEVDVDSAEHAIQSMPKEELIKKIEAGLERMRGNIIDVSGKPKQNEPNEI